MHHVSGCLTNPDCNPLDYYVWSTIEQETNKTLCDTKTKILGTCTNLNKVNVGNTCRRFQSCLEAVVEVNGDFFE